MSTDAAEQFNIQDAKTYLTRIVDRVEHGEEIIISRAGQPVARMIPIERKVHRTGRGSLRGSLVVDDWCSPKANGELAHQFGFAE